MTEKEELLKTLGFSEELLKYFQESPLETQIIVEQEFDSNSFESHDLTNIPNFDQVELAGTTFTFTSKE